MQYLNQEEWNLLKRFYPLPLVQKIYMKKVKLF